MTRPISAAPSAKPIACISASGLSYAILRPGFVFAPAAYGGSALLRALAAWPIDLPQSEMSKPFAAIAVEDIAETVAVLAQRLSGAKIGGASST